MPSADAVDAVIGRVAQSGENGQFGLSELTFFEEKECMLVTSCNHQY